jgi:LacI family gluconate utilization system Gnt-I transcriptional repressor
MSSADGRRAADRRSGFREAFEAGGGQAPEGIVFGGVTTFGQGRAGLARALDAGERPDVVVCTSDWSAHGVLTEALRRGVRVPQDIAVVGFGDLDFSAETEPPLTTVRIDGAAIAREAVGILIGPRGEGPQVVDIGFELVKRASG